MFLEDVLPNMFTAKKLRDKKNLLSGRGMSGRGVGSWLGSHICGAGTSGCTNGPTCSGGAACTNGGGASVGAGDAGGGAGAGGGGA